MDAKKPPTAEIDDLRNRVRLAWKSCPRPTHSQVTRELSDVDTPDLIARLRDATIDDLLADAAELGSTSLFSYGGPKCKQYYLQVYLLYALDRLASDYADPSSMSCDLVVVSLVHYLFHSKKLGVANDRFFTQAQSDCIRDFQAMIDRYPSWFGGW